MAGFNTSKQKVVKLAGAYLETGTIDFDGADLTVEVPTKLNTKVLCGMGTTEDATAASQDAVITSGCVTFTRPSGGTSGATLNYFLIGY